MSWLARSIANTLRLDDEEEDEDRKSNVENLKPEIESHSLPSHSQSTPPSGDGASPRGVKEDLSELTKTLTRQFWGVASLLAPPPASPSSDPSDQAESVKVSDEEEALIAGIRSDFAEIGGKFRTGISKLSSNIAVSEFSKIASNLLQFGSEEGEFDQRELGNAVGVTEEVVAFARDVAMHPETWLDFPVADIDDFDDFDMSDAQQEHALAVERLAPRLAALRIELCPGYMSEDCFWKIYFVLLHPRLNKHDAELLSTPQIMEARAMLMKELQSRAKAKPVQDQPEGGISKGTADSAHEETLCVPSSSQSKLVPINASGSEAGSTRVAVDIETEKHPVHSTEIPVVDKSVIKEGLMSQVKHEQSTAGSSKVLDDKFEDDGDDWLNEETSEAASKGSIAIPIGNDDDISFSDLEDDDGDVPISYKKSASSSDSPTKDSRDWVQLSRSSADSVKDVSCVGEKAASGQVNAHNPETKESNDWLDIEEIM